MDVKLINQTNDVTPVGHTFGLGLGGIEEGINATGYRRAICLFMILPLVLLADCSFVCSWDTSLHMELVFGEYFAT
jgi:hypothetical protein